MATTYKTKAITALMWAGGASLLVYVVYKLMAASEDHRQEQEQKVARETRMESFTTLARCLEGQLSDQALQEIAIERPEAWPIRWRAAQSALKAQGAPQCPAGQAPAETSAQANCYQSTLTSEEHRQNQFTRYEGARIVDKEYVSLAAKRCNIELPRLPNDSNSNIFVSFGLSAESPRYMKITKEQDRLSSEITAPVLEAERKKAKAYEDRYLK